MRSFKVIGLNKVLSELSGLEAEISKEVDAELKSIADAILADAVSRVHVLSGALKASAYVNKSTEGYDIGFSAVYAPYEEFGTGSNVNAPSEYGEFAMEFKVPGGRKRDGNPHPFLFPAFLSKREEIVTDLENKINELLKSK